MAVQVLAASPADESFIEPDTAVFFDVRSADPDPVGEIVVVARFPGFPFAELIYIGDPANSTQFEGVYSACRIHSVVDPGFQRFTFELRRNPVWPDTTRVAIYANGGGGGSLTINVEENGTPKGSVDTVNFIGASVSVTGSQADVSGLQGPPGADGTVNLSHAPFVTLSISSNAITIDLSAGGLFDLTLTSNVTTVTMANPTSSEANFFSLRIKQDGTGGRAFTPPASWKFSTGAYVVSSAANSVDRLQGISHDNGVTYDVSYLKNFA